MTEPLIVDTDQLDSASKILGRAAGAIPAPLPKLSVPGTDPLSLAVARGAVQMEAPMSALSAIKADATTTAQNIGVAGQKYSAVDQAYAEKAKQLQQQFGTDGSKPPQIGVDRNPLTIDQREAIKQRTHELQNTVMHGAGEVAGTASSQIGKAVMKGPGVGEGLQKWFKDPGKLGFESGFTRSNVVTATIMAVPSAINDIASGESVGKVVTSKAAGVGAGVAAGAAGQILGTALTAATFGSAAGPLGTAAGLVVGLGFAYVASGAAENLVGNIWDGLASWTSGG
jgi:hypothetical protein